MRRAAPVMPDATEKSWRKNPEKHPFDFSYKVVSDLN